ncbi:MAG: glycosyltransferase family 2 protein [Flavobacteriales bacterium]|nr:glycosyltransferase family 2 protein [Flavobacteriales bacterium]
MIDLSIVIPVFQEGHTIQRTIPLLIDRISQPEAIEIIVVDFAESTPLDLPSIIYLNSKKKGRAAQMNYGASKAKGKILYFLHADSFPPEDFDGLIKNEVVRGSEAGSFLMDFDKESRFLKFFAWFTRFSNVLCAGGDQSFFIASPKFKELGGYNEEMNIMEDLDIVKRAKRAVKYTVIKKAKLVTSARKYEANGLVRLQLLFAILHLKYRMGFSQDSMSRFYRKHIVTP